MDLFGVIGRVVGVSLISLILSLLALTTVKRMGFDMKDFRQRAKPGFLLVAAFFNGLFVLSIWLIYTFIEDESFSTLGFQIRLDDWVFVIIALILTLVIAIIFVFALNANKIVFIKWKKPRVASSFAVIGALLSYGVLFLAAFQEEVMFRGYFACVLHPYGVYDIVIWSTVIFTLWHFITNKVKVFQTIDWLLGGFMLIYVYLVTESIWVAALVHFSRNFANVLILNIAQTHSLVETDKPIEGKFKNDLYHDSFNRHDFVDVSLVWDDFIGERVRAGIRDLLF